MPRLRKEDTVRGACTKPQHHPNCCRSGTGSAPDLPVTEGGSRELLAKNNEKPPPKYQWACSRNLHAARQWIIGCCADESILISDRKMWRCRWRLKSFAVSGRDLDRSQLFDTDPGWNE